MFQPNVNDELNIEGTIYRITEHPHAPGIPYGQEGRAGTVYQVIADGERRALKVFKPRFRLPSLVSLSKRLGALAKLPGLSVCNRDVLVPQENQALLREHPDLLYAVIMPWIEGPTWMEVLSTNRELTPEQSMELARGFATVLATMEQEELAHCDLSGPNVMVPLFAGPGAMRDGLPVELVDVETMYGRGLNRPEAVPAGSAGYAHKTAPEGLWVPEADRFAGGLILAEMLGWCDPRVRAAAWGENYFDPEEMQQDVERYRVLTQALSERWGAGMARLFEQVWGSASLSECPAFGSWLLQLGGPAQRKETITPAASKPTEAAAPAPSPVPTPPPAPSPAPAQPPTTAYQAPGHAAASQQPTPAGPQPPAGAQPQGYQQPQQPQQARYPQYPQQPQQPPYPVYQQPPQYPQPQPQQYQPQPGAAGPQQYPQQPYGYGPPQYPAYPQQQVPQQAKKSGTPIWVYLLVGFIALCAVAGVGVYLAVQSGVNAVRSGIDAVGTSIAATATAIVGEYGSGQTGQASENAPLVEHELKTDPAREFAYADLKFTVSRGVISNRVPGDDTRFRTDGATLTLDLSVSNETNNGIYISPAQAQVKLGDGSVYKQPFDISMDSRDSGDSTLEFEVPLTTTWDGAILHIDEVGKEPVEIPLAGEMAAPQYPVELAAGAEASVEKPKLTFKIKGGKVDLDGAGQRAPTGKRYVILNMLVVCNDTLYNAYVGPTSFRLIVDGTPKGPEQLTPAAEAIDPSSEAEFEAVFLIPADAAKAELEVGEADKSTAKIPIDLKGVKP